MAVGAVRPLNTVFRRKQPQARNRDLARAWLRCVPVAMSVLAEALLLALARHWAPLQQGTFGGNLNALTGTYSTSP
jgi:hypothetical protein